MSTYKRRSRKTKNAARQRRKPRKSTLAAKPLSRVQRRAGTKTRVIGKADTKPPKSRFSRTRKVNGKYVRTNTH